MTETELVTFLGTAALKGAVILAAAGLVNTAWRSASASARHLVWTIGVASALTLPLLSAAIQRVGAPRIEISAWSPAVVEVAKADAPPVTTDIADPSPTDEKLHSVPAAEVNVYESAAFESSLEAGGATAVDDVPAQSATAPPVPIMSLKERVTGAVTALPADWRKGVFYLWIAGLTASLLPLMMAMVRVRVLASRATTLSRSRWSDLIENTPSIAHLAGGVRVMESGSATMPMTWGILSPTLLVPSASERWPEWQCRNILLHELAHVERRDCLTQLVAQLACAVYWFNPLVWIAAHRMRVERELACDDRVISAGSRASAYAANLLR